MQICITNAHEFDYPYYFPKKYRTRVVPFQTNSPMQNRSYFPLFRRNSWKHAACNTCGVHESIRGGHSIKAFQSSRTPSRIFCFCCCWLFIPRRCPVVPLRAPTHENPPTLMVLGAKNLLAPDSVHCRCETVRDPPPTLRFVKKQFHLPGH